MKRMGLVSLLALLAMLALPGVASAHYTGYPHRHVYGYGYGYRVAPGVPVLPTFNIDRPGLYFGGSLIGDIVVNQAGKPGGQDFISHGGGGSLFLGVRLNPYLGLEFGYGQTIHNPVSDYWGNLVDYLALNQFTADLKVIFPNPSNVRPFIQGGAGLYVLTQNYSEPVAGGGVQLGGGVDIWLTPWWSLGGRLMYHGIKFGDVGNGTTSSKPFLSTAALDVNLQFHF